MGRKGTAVLKSMQDMGARVEMGRMVLTTCDIGMEMTGEVPGFEVSADLGVRDRGAGRSY